VVVGVVGVEVVVWFWMGGVFEGCLRLIVGGGAVEKIDRNKFVSIW